MFKGRIRKDPRPADEIWCFLNLLLLPTGEPTQSLSQGHNLPGWIGIGSVVAQVPEVRMQVQRAVGRGQKGSYWTSKPLLTLLGI